MTHRLQSEIVYNNQWICVQKDMVQFKDKTTSEYGVIRHKAKSVVVLVEKDNNLLISNNFRYVLQNNSLEFPAGLMEKNETPEQTAYREVLEETGVLIENMKVLFHYYPSNGTSDQEIIIIKAGYKSGVLLPQLNEVNTVEWVDKNNILTWVKSGLITDGPTIMATMSLFLSF